MEPTEKSISDSVAFASMWHGLSHNQKRFAIAMLEHATKKDAALAIGLQPDTVYRWNGDVDAVVDYMRDNAASAALGIVTANASKAAMVMGALLDSRDENVRVRAAQDTLDRNLGKPTQRHQMTGAADGPIEVSFIDYRAGIAETEE